MSYGLCDDIYGCVIGDQAACLDLQSDRYFLIPRDTFNAMIAEPPLADDLSRRAVLQRLVEKGIVREGPGPALAEQLITRKAAECDPSKPPFSSTLLAEAIGYQIAAALKLKLSSLLKVVNSLKARKAKTTSLISDRTEDELLRVASAFRASGKFFMSDGRCLRRSIALADCLIRRQLPFELVFGVALQPFAAHCWVQYEDTILNDRAEEIDGYQPILVV